jgi:glutamate racemase
MPDVEVIEQACPPFVPLVEAGKWDSAEAREAVRHYVGPLISAKCEVLILGCTHYPFLTRFIRQEAGPGVTIIDPAEETAVEAANILFDARMLNPPTTEPVYSYFTSAAPEQFTELGSPLLGSRITGVRKIEWGPDLREITWQEKTAEQTMKSAL